MKKTPQFFWYFFRISLPLSLITVVISYVLFSLNSIADHASLMTQELLITEQQEKLINHQMQSIVTDLKYLSKTRSLIGFEENYEVNKSQIEEVFLTYLETEKIYDQIRFIDMHGMEKVRVNWDSGHPDVVPDDQLQDKSKRYYFLNSITLKQGEVYISPFDLNIEHNKLEEPYKPMIRFATAVFDRQGKKIGVLILNYLGTNLLEQLSGLDKSVLGHILLLNQDGFYLFSPEKSDEWGFMFPDRVNSNFAVHHPQAWDIISDENKGQFQLKGELFSFTTIRPLQDELHSTSKASSTLSQNDTSLPVDSLMWKLISYIPDKNLGDIKNENQFLFILFDFLLLTFITLGSWQIASVTCKKNKALADLEQEKEKFKTAIDYTYDWEYWRGPDNSYLYVSPSCKRVTGYSADDFVKNPDLLLDIVHPDDLEMLRDHLHGVVEGPCMMDFRIVLSNGDEKWIGHTCQPVFNQDGEFLGRRGSNQDITLRKKMELELKKSSTHDVLTGLPNRTLLYERLEQLLAQAERSHSKVAILFIDLDEFKEINDTLGHESGDTVLIETTKRMLSNTRQGDSVARLGGDEFVIVLPNIEDSATIKIVASKLLEVISQDIEFNLQGGRVTSHIGASIGISIYPQDGHDRESLIQAADKAMYSAKQSGKNKFVLYNSQFNTESVIDSA